MTIPRSQQISLSDTPYYHVTSRCVRRAFLCGKDPLTNKSYEHRRQWIEDRIRLLSSLFAIEIYAYSLMENHIHVLVKLTPDESNHWTVDEVIERWFSIFKGPLLVRDYYEGKSLSKAQVDSVTDIVEIWRKRLQSLSWFMKCLNEPIARQANKEDGCTGHFWESRFHCQPLISDEALLTCMVYVDLNPVRAGIADTPECSKYTSIKERIKPQFNLSRAIKSYICQGGFSEHLQCENPIPIKPLVSFIGGERLNQAPGIHFEFKDYLELVDFTGRAIRDDKTGHINEGFPPILQRLGMDEMLWFDDCQNFEARYYQRFCKKRKKAAA